MTDYIKVGPRIIVCGGRDYSDTEMIDWTLRPLFPPCSGNDPEMRVLVHGACQSGADYLADDWALGHDVIIETHPPDWVTHGLAAGPIRNQEMADAGAELCVAFPGGRGTNDMVKRARAAGIRVMDLRDIGGEA